MIICVNVRAIASLPSDGLRHYTHHHQPQAITYSGGGITTMTFDVGNRMKERSLPNGVKTIYDYRPLAELRLFDYF
jgi:hypothetical protein